MATSSMLNRRKVFFIALALCVAVQAAAARPWLAGLVSHSSRRLSEVQKQMQENQLRRLMVLTEQNVAKPVVPHKRPAVAKPTSSTLGYGYGSIGGYGYGSLSEAGFSSSKQRGLLAPVLDYDSEIERLQAVMEAGEAWKPSSDSIELQEAGKAATSRQQFYEEGDEVAVGPVPDLLLAKQ